MKVAFYTFGCKVNQYETRALMELFSENGFSVCEMGDDCEVYVVNSCTVTGEGDNKVRKLFRRLRREHPQALLVLCGCMAQASPETAAAAVPEADVVTGAKHRERTVSLIRTALEEKRRVISIVPHEGGDPFEPLKIKRFSGRTRAFLKIQDGCERFCSYCIVPKARGGFRSKPIPDIVSELHELYAAGFPEVVLSGVNLSAYGLDCGLRLIDAVEAASGVTGIARLRLSSIEPDLITPDDVRRLKAIPNLCPQFHLPLQSGSDRTLARMGRRYTAAEFLKLVSLLRESFENPAITADIMVGFPGESDLEFSESLEFVRGLGLLKAHVFAYSVRPGTAAERLPEQVPQAVKRERLRQMISVTSLKRQEFLQSQTGKTASVLFETIEGGHLFGHSENYTPVRVNDFAGSKRPDIAEQGRVTMTGRIRRVAITGAERDFCTGDIV